MAPSSNSSVPPLSTVVLLTVPAETSNVTPLLTVKRGERASHDEGPRYFAASKYQIPPL